MKYYFLVCLCLCLWWNQVHGDNFFSRLMSRGKKETGKSNNDYEDVCESVKVMPRLALAVVGGAPLQARNSAPYVAALGQTLPNGSVSWFCGGSLVSSRHVLTAAHCLVSRNVTTIRVGSFSTKKNPTENDYEVVETIIHPDYKITQSYNDIAIVKIKDKITFSQNIKPVCLPENNNEKYNKEKAKVIGWGAEEFGGEGTQKLQQVEVEVFTNEECEKRYSNSTIAPKTFPRGIVQGQLCAGSPKGGKDACQGDSGGPLVLTDESGVVRQIGIVSTGAGCGFKMYPGVYVRVSSYKNWIQNQINAKSSPSQSSKPSNSKNQSNSNQHSSNSNQATTKKPSHNNGNNLNNSGNDSSKNSAYSNHKDDYVSKDGNFQNSNNNFRPSSNNERLPHSGRQPSSNSNYNSGQQQTHNNYNNNRQYETQTQGRVHSRNDPTISG